MIKDATLAEANALLAALQERGLTLATAESCTGGLIAAAMTAWPGSSSAILAGFVTYSNDAKADMLGVDPGLIAAHGAVSEPVARAMAEGALARSRASIAVSCTGVAGPGGGSEAKPVGCVYLAVARAGRPTQAGRHDFPGDRTAVREATVRQAFALVRGAMD
ncbi:MAG: nicotinamide-nucleotide amidohydrolase family protein [Acetobacteraceae bacterium]|nr:nicotinamide-nucleotide amidohydrolase family protein [Acetobacteraceae bacterium]